MPTPAYTGPNVSTANGVATVFPYDFQILDEDHLVVTADGAAASGYTVDGVGEEGGGNITFSVAPANGVEVLRERLVPYERENDYQRNGAWREDTVDEDMDLLEMQIQQLKAISDRSPKLAAGSAVAGDDFELPAPVASKLIGWNADGDGLTLYSMGEFGPDITVTAFAETVLDDADAKTAMATLSNFGVLAASAPFDLRQTWNNGAVTFRGMDISITDAASADHSTVLRARVGGVDLLNLEKDGLFTASGRVNLGGSSLGSAGFGVSIQSAMMTGNDQAGMVMQAFLGGENTAVASGITSILTTRAGAHTHSSIINFSAAAVTKGAGNTINNIVSYDAADQTEASVFAAGFRSQLTVDGTKKWNAFFDGSAPNHFSAAVRCGTQTAAGFSEQLLAASGTSAAYPFAVVHSHASNPFGFRVSYSAAAPNDTGHYFGIFGDNAANRVLFTSNGGISNFQANDVNLSDRKVKSEFKEFTDKELDALEAAFIKVDWGKFKYDDQDHDDWNYGPSADGVAKAFRGTVDSITDIWNPITEEPVFDRDGNLVKIKRKATKKADQLKGIYTHDLENIGLALLARTMKRVTALEAKV